MRYLLNYARFREKLCSEVSLTSCLVNSMLNREGVDETKLAKGGSLTIFPMALLLG